MDAAMIERARAWLEEAEALLVMAGAGMGVDSGLPDFRGPEGFWKAYPPYEKLGASFYDMANPENFLRSPATGWGFYGHRYHLYRGTEPHGGFQLLRQFGESLPGKCFVFTSNVDGHFQRAGFEPARVVECHGSLNHLQCLAQCSSEIWPVGDDFEVAVDESTMEAVGGLPACRQCDGLARPNVLMFGDFGWNGARTERQEARFREWRRAIASRPLVIVEIGAGMAVPTVRRTAEAIAFRGNTALIRINPREPEVPSASDRAVGISGGALEVLRQLVE